MLASHRGKYTKIAREKNLVTNIRAATVHLAMYNVSAGQGARHVSEYARGTHRCYEAPQ